MRFALLTLLVTVVWYIEVSATDGYYAIKGLNTGIGLLGSGSRPARRNIFDLQKDVPSW